MSLSPIKPRFDVPGDVERYQRDLQNKKDNPRAWGDYSSLETKKEEFDSYDEGYSFAIKQCCDLLGTQKSILVEQALTLKLEVAPRDSKESIVQALLMNQLKA